MARIVGIDIPDQKHIVIALTYIFGIGRSSAEHICRKANIPAGTKTKELTEEQLVRIRDLIENDYKIEGALRSENTMNIKRLMEIGSYRGLRHKQGLPVQFTGEDLRQVAATLYIDRGKDRRTPWNGGAR